MDSESKIIHLDMPNEVYKQRDRSSFALKKSQFEEVSVSTF